MRISPQITELERVAVILAQIDQNFIYVGGATVGLFLTDSGSAEPRPTDDVDVIVEILEVSDHAKLEEELRRLGFSNDEQIIVRWHGHNSVVDVVTIEDIGYGPTNRWYKSGSLNVSESTLPLGTIVSHLDAPHFIATKLEAFADRGLGDYYASHDLEDVWTVIDGRPEIEEEFAAAPEELKEFLGYWFGEFLEKADHRDLLEGFLGATGNPVERLSILRERIANMTY